ncbi:hypothetical protein [Piscinibacter gummiphilus]|uniref:Energy transducer TonB n=1 Tax=Piscinibacter gummiphilus TaxID=946333 RepID=A0ABZ0CY96_9BURK|nr:hypothetical protein [Piscinibacter gummiphilus]WOB07454.1 hypothetical protein RXV79_21385 [Piscinibacter gummiphilus]
MKSIQPTHAVAALAALVVAFSAQAQNAFMSEPVQVAAVKPSQAADAKTYRQDGARHLYDAYPDRIYRGKLPPLLHAVAVVETVIDGQGQVVEVNMIREPSHAPDVTAAVREMIKRAQPLPVPARISGGVRYLDVWLMDGSGRFQLDTLTEGQRRE